MRREVTHGVMWLERDIRRRRRSMEMITEGESDDSSIEESDGGSEGGLPLVPASPQPPKPGSESRGSSLGQPASDSDLTSSLGQPTPGEWRALFCRECTRSQKKEGAVIIKDGGDMDVIVRDDVPLDFVSLTGRCKTCYKKADYAHVSGGSSGGGGACAAHKEKGMVYIRPGKGAKRCKHVEGCERQATFGRPSEGGTPVRCSTHKRRGDVDVRNKLCKSTGCSSRPSYGPRPTAEGARATAVYCAKHRLSGHVDVKNTRRCNVGVSIHAGIASTLPQGCG